MIDQPIVTVPNWDYPMVKFIPGDLVSVSASGCVQTGGTSFLGGGTWKNYVYPYPPQGLYYGTVTIPEAFVELGPPLPEEAPIYSLLGGGFWRPVTVKDLAETDKECVTPARGLHLQLGYMDDNNWDNGYWGHDDGDLNQCAGDTAYPFSNHGQPAQVTLLVRHGVSGVDYSAMPWDVVPNCIDENHIFMNAQWGWQGGAPPSYGGSDNNPPSTAQVTSYDNMDAWKQVAAVIVNFFNSLISPYFWLVEEFEGGLLCHVTGGHRNWFDVTYTGRLQWDDFSGGWPNDDDYNINLWTSQVKPTGYAEGGMIEGDSRQRIHMEFFSNETIDEFTYHGTWWDGLRSAVDDSNDQASKKISGLYAIAIGLIGVDEVHGASSGNEMHPVHALAVHHGRTLLSDHKFRDQWALFVRNSGNEGECSSLDHYLLLNQVAMRIGPSIDPTASDSTGVPYISYVDPSSSFISRSNMWASGVGTRPYTYYAPLNDATHPDLLLSFNLTDPPSHSWYAGDFDIDWTTTNSVDPSAFRPLTVDTFPLFPPPGTQSRNSTQQALQVVGATDTSAEPEQKMAAIWGAMTPDQQADALNLYQVLVPPRALREVVSVAAVQVYTPPSRPQHVPQVDVGLLPDWEIMRRAARARGLCAANYGSIPNAPTACGQVPPITLLTTSGGASGKNGWIVTPLTVTLTARDASGAGIDHTEYGFDGVNYVPYTGPFVAPEGEITVYYRSQDKAGNLEPANQRSFKIDTRPPTSQATSVMNATNVTMTYSVTDPMPGSGPAGLHTISHAPAGLASRYTPAPAGTITFDTLCTDIEYWGEDVAGNEQLPHLRTPDLVPPVLTVQPDSFCMWPPNHRRVRFRLGSEVSATATDNCEASPKVAIVSVTSNEPDNGLGDGDTPGDVSFSPSAFCVRRERSGMGTGRVYTVTVEAKDYSGNTTRKQVQVTVPHSQQAGCGAVGTEIPEGVPCQ